MKRISVVLFLLLAGLAPIQAQTAAEKIAAGRTALAAHDGATARTRFSEALGIESSNQTAALLLGLTRVAGIAGQNASHTFLNTLAVTATGRDVFHWDAALPRDVNGNIVLPANYNLTTVASFWQASVLPETTAARANLALVTNPSFLLTLFPLETTMPTALTLDHGDVLLSRASLSALEFLLHFLSGQNLSANLDALNRLSQDGLLTLPRLLTDNPNFFLLGSTSERTAAKASLLETIQLYRQASTFIRTTRPAGVNRLFMLAAADLPQEAEFRAELDKIERSLTEPVPMGERGQRYATTGPIFGPTWSARAQLPAFTTNGFDLGSITDASLGGVVAGISREEIARFFDHPELGWQWVSPTPQGNSLHRHLALANGKRIVTGDVGTVYTSNDGTTWTLRSIPGAGRISGLAEGTGALAGKVIGVCSDTIFLTSDYGVTWEIVFRGGAQLRAVTYGGGQFVAVGDWGASAVSTDGRNWAYANSGPISHFDVIHAGTFYLAVGFDNNQGKAVIQTSTNGLTWTNQFTAASGGYSFHGVAQGAANFVVVGDGNHSVVSANTSATTAWTASTVLAAGTTRFNGVAYRSSGAFFVAAGAGGAVATISDSALAGSATATWTTQTTGEDLTLNGVGNASDGVYFAGGAGVILRSTNLTASSGIFARVVNPTSVAAPTISFNAVRAIDGQLYAVGSGGTIVRSSNGLTYSAATSSGTTNALYGVLKQGGTFFAVGDAGTILTSADGATWTPIISGSGGSNSTANLRSIGYLNGQFVVTGSGGTILTSATGASNTWTSRTTGAAGTIYGVAYGLVGTTGTYVAVGGNGGTGPSGIGYIYTSIDSGITWTPRPFGSNSTLRAVVFSLGAFTVVGHDGSILRSPDGSNWSFVHSGAYTHLVGLRALNGRYYALQSAQGSYFSEPQCAVLVSSDGLHWTRVPQGASTTQWDLEYFFDGTNRRLLTVGDAATILRTAAIPAVTVPVVAALTPNRLAPQGANLILAGGSNGDGGETYAWTKNGSSIAGATGPALHLMNIQTGDAGSYVLTVTNAAGSTPATAVVVTVDSNPVAPVITQPPGSQIVNVGLTARFTVVANGTAPFAYQWKKDGVNLTDVGNVSGSTSATLVLANVQYTDGGTYSVVVSGVAPSATSESAVLTVDSNPAYTFSTLAGTAGFVGSADATGSLARFFTPGAVAADASGNLYVADSGNHTIRKLVVATGVVTTLAGSAGNPGLVNGVGTAAKFASPKGLAFDAGSGSLFVADPGNQAIRKINLSTREVTTFASAIGQPNFIVADSAGNIFFTASNHVVRKITADGVTSTIFAGAVDSAGLVNGDGGAARFNGPLGIAIDASGNLYVADSNNQVVRRIIITTSGASVSTFAGLSGSFGYDDGPAGVGLVYYPVGIAVDAAGYVYVTESYTSRVRKISPTGTIRTVGGEVYMFGSTDGIGREARFGLPSGLALDASGNLFVADTQNHTLRKGVPSASLLAPAIGVPPRSVTAMLGGSITLSVDATGATSPSPLSYQWRRNGSNLATGTGATLTLTNLTAGDAGNYTVLVTNGQGTALSPAATLAVVAVIPPPTIASFAPASAGGGQTVVITGTGFSEVSRVAVNSTDAVFVVDSATQITLTVPMLATTGPILVTTGSGTAASTTSLTVPQVRALVNQSTRVALSTSNPDLVAGFTVQGNSPKSILLRAVGPTLSTFGVTGALADPILSLHDGTGAQIAINDDWGGGSALSSAFAAVGAFSLPANSRDSAILMTLNPGTYSVRVAGVAGGVGVVLVETYDVDTTPRMRQLATRSYVGTGSNILISGFVISGTIPQNVLVRALGPTLGVAGALLNPTLSIFSGSSLVASNDNWNVFPALNDATVAVGAMPLATGSNDAALLVRLNPGAYTAQVAGVGSTTGVAQVEVFQVDGYVPATAPALIAPARNYGVDVGSGFALAAPFVAKPNLVTFQWRKNGSDIVGATNKAFAISSVAATDAGSYSVVLTNGQGPTTSADHVLVVGGSPMITVMPAVAQSVVVGGNLAFGVTATGNPAPAYQWRRNDTDIPGATQSSITITGATQANAGVYRVVVSNTIATITSNPITVSVIERALLSLLSRVTVPVRGTVSGSFIVEGGSKNVLIRAVGPSLDLTGGLVDPRIALLNAAFVPTNTNDDWGTNANAAAIASTATALGLAPALATSSHDAALLVTLVPGTYTIMVDGVGGTGGIVQLDIVDADTGLWPRFSMLAMRGPVTANANLNVGFYVSGTVEQKYLIRALGPTLGYNSAGSNGVLVDPYLYVYRGETFLASDDDSYADPVIDAATALVGAMPRIGRYNFFTYYDNYDSTLLMNLQPGAHTARVRPYATHQAGDALLEVFAADEQHPTIVPPAITYLSTNQQAVSLGDAAFGVVVISKPAATFQWRRYVGGVATPIPDATASVLRLSNLQSSDAGSSFDVVVSNGTTTLTSPQRTLTILTEFHSADTSRDRQIDLSEVTRVIQLHNTTEGGVRTGQYHAQAGTEDGFAPGPGPLTSFHAADTDRDGRISGAELARVIELYTYVSATVRTGQYHPQVGTEDGFAPGPAAASGVD